MTRCFRASRDASRAPIAPVGYRHCYAFRGLWARRSCSGRRRRRTPRLTPGRVAFSLILPCRAGAAGHGCARGDGGRAGGVAATRLFSGWLLLSGQTMGWAGGRTINLPSLTTYRTLKNKPNTGRNTASVASACWSPGCYSTTGQARLYGCALGRCFQLPTATFSPSFFYLLFRTHETGRRTRLCVLPPLAFGSHLTHHQAGPLSSLVRGPPPTFGGKYLSLKLFLLSDDSSTMVWN